MLKLDLSVNFCLVEHNSITLLIMGGIYGPELRTNQSKPFLENDKLILFGSQSESLSDFYDLAIKLKLDPICVDNLDKTILSPKHVSLHYTNLVSFHFDLPVVVSIISPEARFQALNHAVELGFKHFPPFMDPNSDITNSGEVGKGGFINSSAIVGSNVVISDYVTINRGANIGHDVEIGEFTHIAPSSCILGSVKIGKNVTIGANSTILPKLKIGDRAIIGAGSVVTRDVLADQVVCGNPAKNMIK